MKWLKFNLKVSYLHLFPFESVKSFEQIRFWISLFNNISMTIFLKKKKK
jgi:hypothetical protein